MVVPAGAAVKRAAYDTAEATARIGRGGLWQDAGAVLPWDWRRYSFSLYLTGGVKDEQWN
jgi:hypothetical protein